MLLKFAENAPKRKENNTVDKYPLTVGNWLPFPSDVWAKALALQTEGTEFEIHGGDLKQRKACNSGYTH